MKYIKQFAIIIAVSFVGEIAAHFIPLPIPASIWGLTLMLVLLVTRIIPLGAVRETAKFLVSLMQIMFIPAAVGLLTSLDALKSAWLPILISIVVVTPIVFFCSGKLTDAVIARSAQSNDGKEADDNA
jgi:holin-like protein